MPAAESGALILVAQAGQAKEMGMCDLVVGVISSLAEQDQSTPSAHARQSNLFLSHLGGGFQFGCQVVLRLPDVLVVQQQRLASVQNDLDGAASDLPFLANDSAHDPISVSRPRRPHLDL